MVYLRVSRMELELVGLMPSKASCIRESSGLVTCKIELHVKKRRDVKAVDGPKGVQDVSLPLFPPDSICTRL